MIGSRHLVSVLRRDAHAIWHAAIVAVFLGFAGLALAATFVDLAAVWR